MAAACGGAPAAQRGPGSPPSPAQSSIPAEDPAAALAKAEHDLDQALALSDHRDREAQSAVSDLAEAAAPSPEPSAAPAEAAGRAEAAPRRAESKAYAEPPPTRCELACRAYASMGRATESLCDLGGEEEARCVDARSRLEHASARLSASCGGCGS